MLQDTGPRRLQVATTHGEQCMEGAWRVYRDQCVSGYTDASDRWELTLCQVGRSTCAMWVPMHNLAVSMQAPGNCGVPCAQQEGDASCSRLKPEASTQRCFSG